MGLLSSVAAMGMQLLPQKRELGSHISAFFLPLLSVQLVRSLPKQFLVMGLSSTRCSLGDARETAVEMLRSFRTMCLPFHVRSTELHVQACMLSRHQSGPCRRSVGDFISPTNTTCASQLD